MSTIFKTRINAEPCIGEVHENRELLTRPDGFKSMSEILTKFSQGIPLTGRNNPVYNLDWIHPDLDHMDLVEVEELKEEYAKSVSVKRKALMEKHLKDKKDADVRYRRELEDSIREELRSGKRGGDKKDSSSDEK